MFRRLLGAHGGRVWVCDANGTRRGALRVAEVPLTVYLWISVHECRARQRYGPDHFATPQVCHFFPGS